MHKELKRTDITDLPDIIRLAEEVRQSGEPQVLKSRDEDLAILTPLAPEVTAKPAARRRAKAANPNDWLLGLIHIGANVTPADHATDVSANVDKYLAEAYYNEFHPPAKK